MLKRINQILGIIMGGITAVYIGYSIWQYWDYRTHPMLYKQYSAPWYTGIRVYGVLALAVLAVCLIPKLMIHKKMKQ